MIAAGNLPIPQVCGSLLQTMDQGSAVPDGYHQVRFSMDNGDGLPRQQADAVTSPPGLVFLRFFIGGSAIGKCHFLGKGGVHFRRIRGRAKRNDAFHQFRMEARKNQGRSPPHAPPKQNDPGRTEPC